MADGTPKPNVETRRKRCERRLAQLLNERDQGAWVPHWRDLAEFFMPRRGRLTLAGTGSEVYNKGDKRHQKIIDGTPISARETLSAGMMAGITSPARPWFRNTVADPDLRERQDVKTWLSDVDRNMRDVLARSNFYEAVHAFYDEIGTFGTAAMLADEDAEDVVVFRTLTAGEYVLGLDSRNRVDTLYRQFRMTVRQVVQEFGYDACSQSVKNQYDNGNVEQWVDVVHAIEPNDERDPSKADRRGMAYRSVYYEANYRDALLRERGYRECPILSARWSVLGGDTYGTSPAMNALGDAKALQIQERRKALAIDKMVDPPLNVPVEMRNTRISSIPGGINYYSQAGGQRPGITPAHEPNSTILTPLLEDEQQLRERINRFMFADLFLMLANSDRRQITAREIEERHEEKLLMLGPVLERLNSEFLNRLIDRLFGIMLRAGMIPPPPESLQGVTLKTEYISVLAQAQKQVALGGLDNFLQRASMVFQVSPSTMDKVDFDQIIDETADMLGVSPRIVRSDDDVAAKRQSEQQMQQMQQMAAMAKPATDVAGAVTKMAGTETAENSVMAQVANAMAGAAPA